MRSTNERGIALITSLLVMMLMSALLVGFTAVVMSDQRFRFIDRDRGQAFYGANGGVEKLTADLGNLFLTNVAPTATQVTNMVATGSKPTIPGITFTAPLTADVLPTSSLTKCVAPNTQASQGYPGYTIRYCAAPNGNPTTTSVTPIKSGPYEGLIAQQMPYQLDVTAKTATGGEVHLVRTMEAVAIPVFQFGIFSDVDLSFFAGPNFNFGGRVHTNNNLFLSEGTGATLTLTDKVTAVKEIIRQRLQNGASIDTAPAHDGIVSMAQSPGVFRPLLRTEGSVIAGPSTNPADWNEPTWHTTSLSAYNSWIRNGRTGAKTLNLALITVGGTNPDLIRRPPVGEAGANPVLFGERLFGKASLRVLLSDTAVDITNLPTVTGTPPVQLDGNWRVAAPNNGIAAYGPVGAARPPIARAPGLVTALITGGDTAGTNKTLTVAVPAAFKIPDTLVVTKGAGVWTLTGCSATKTATTFTCTAVTPTHAATTTTNPATVSGNVTTADGTVIPVQTTTSANWVNNNMTLTVNAGLGTMAFSEHSFWVNGNLVSCGGYTAATFTNCTLSATIPNNSTLTTSVHSNANTGTIGGFLKIERGNVDGSWTDVTMEILNWGIGGPNLGGFGCGDPSPNAIIRLQRLKDNNWTTCPYAASANSVSTDYWPNVLFDPREALMRDTAIAGNALPLGGLMHYITIDVQNLAQWFRGTGAFVGSTGVNSKLDNGGFTVYFSDRRNNRDQNSLETGDYGFEDFVNPLSATGTPNGTLDTGEDANTNGTLEVYGGVPNYQGVYNSVPPCGAPCVGAPLTAAATPLTTLNQGEAVMNRAILFRHALKLVRGNNINGPGGQGVTGLSIVSENPVYIQGDWNASNGGASNFAGTHAATAVMADSVTLLSNAWNDLISFTQPYAIGNRNRGTPTWYRVAIISGKGRTFPQPAGTATDYGTDGGAHNFLRYLENGDQAVNYRGSMATFFFNRQAVGTFKCCATVYGAPARNYAFDVDFLNPALLPPNTPMFRDLNTVGFAQELRPGR